MFSPLYVGLYLFKSYTGDGEDQTEEDQVTYDDENEEPKPKQIAEKRDFVNKDDIDGAGNLSEPIEQALKCKLDFQTHADISDQISLNEIESVCSKETNDLQFINNNPDSATLIDTEYNSEQSRDEDDNESVEFVDVDPTTEDIKNAKIKQSEDVCDFSKGKYELKTNGKNNEAGVSEIFVVETKFLDRNLPNESNVIYEDIKKSNECEVFTPCNNDTNKSAYSGRQKQETKQPCSIKLIEKSEPRVNDNPYVCASTENTDILSFDNVACSFSKTHLEPGGTAHTYDNQQNQSSTREADDNECLDQMVQEQCFSKKVVSDECMDQIIADKMSTISINEKPNNVNNIAFIHNMTQPGSDTKISDQETDIKTTDEDIPSNSDTEASDISDTVVADGILSSGSSVSDLPEDDATLSRPNNLEVLGFANKNNDTVLQDDTQPSVLSPSKVCVTCITEEETILVEEIVYPINNVDRNESLSPKSASSNIRHSPFSSSECLDFDWNEHCMKMIVTGTPQTSLKMALTGTPKLRINQAKQPEGSSDSTVKDNHLGRNLNDMNQDMREDVEKLRSEMKEKNEEISRLKNITHGLRHRLSQVEQENMKLSQSNDSFLSVKSDTPSNSSSCYNSEISLSYEGSTMRSPSLEENLLLKEEILLLKSKLENKSDTIERLNLQTKEIKAQLTEEENKVRPISESTSNDIKAEKRKIRPFKSVNDISIEEMPRMTPPSSAGSASSVFVNSATLPIPSLAEQTAKKSKSKKIKKLFSFKKKKDKNK